MKFRYQHSNATFSKALRKEGTVGEAMLWLQLKGKQRHGFAFHRQKSIGNYIVDFWCPKLALAIEIDGATHEIKVERDRQRQQDLEKMGVDFLRFLERDVQTNLAGVVASIDQRIEQHPRHIKIASPAEVPSIKRGGA